MRSSSKGEVTHGKRPEERTIPELLRQGVLNVDKPQGPTSHQVTSWVKRILGVEKAGHGGTLDPRVTGVLPVALNDATRALDALLLGSKEYIGVMHLHQSVDRKQVEDVFSDFTGDIFQLPPVRSAVKRERRIRRIHSLKILEFEGRDVLFKVNCQAGTYIRTLCVDIGDALGIGAHLSDLRRTRAANFLDEEASILQDVEDAWILWKENEIEEPLRKILLPMERLLDHLGKVVLKDTAVDAVCHGANLAVPGILHIEQGLRVGQEIALMTRKGEGVALGKLLMKPSQVIEQEQGTAVETKRVFMEPETYPRGWKWRSSIPASNE